MAKVLLVDTNFSSAPLHAELLAMGHEVHVVGNNPADCLAKRAMTYWQVDYSDVDALSDLVDRNRYDFLVPGCTDRSYTSCVRVARNRFPGLDSNTAREAIHNKLSFRETTARLGLPAPRLMGSPSQHASGAVIIKPVDAFSGKGTTILENPDRVALDSAIATARSASASGRYLLEEFVEGQLYSHSCFIRQGTIVADFIVREDSTINPFVVDTSHVVPDANPRMLQALRSAIKMLARDLRLTDGLLHTQYIARDEEFWLIEATRRCPGDLYSQLIELSTGFPYARAYVLPYIGQPFPARRDDGVARPVMRHTVTLDSACDLDHIEFKRALRIERWTPLALVGDHVETSPKGRIAVFFCCADSRDDLAAIYSQTLARNLYSVRDK
jgi:biotin carboxylase